MCLLLSPFSLWFWFFIPLSLVWERECEVGQGRCWEETWEEEFSFGLSLSSPSFLPSSLIFEAPRFSTSHSKHFLWGPPLCSGTETQNEFLQPGGNFVDEMPASLDPSACPAVAGVRLPSETIQFPLRLRDPPKVPWPRVPGYCCPLRTPANLGPVNPLGRRRTGSYGRRGR